MSSRFGNPGMKNPAIPKVNTTRAGCRFSIDHLSPYALCEPLPEGGAGIAKVGKEAVLSIGKAGQPRDT